MGWSAKDREELFWSVLGILSQEQKSKISPALYLSFSCHAKFNYYWLSPLFSRCIKQLLGHGGELSVDPGTRVFRPFLPQPAWTQLHFSLQPPSGTRIWHPAAAPGVYRYNAPDICKKSVCHGLSINKLCLCHTFIMGWPLWPAFFWAGEPDDIGRSQYGGVLVSPGSSSDDTAEFWSGDRPRQAGRGPDAFQRDGLQQSYRAGWGRRHVSDHRELVMLFIYVSVCLLVRPRV